MLTPLAAGNGGYFPPAWGWSAAALLWAAAIAVLVRQEVEFTAAEAVTLSAFGLLTVWMLISAAWSGDTTAAVLEAERMLVYVAGLGSLLLVSRSGAIGSLLAGALAAVTIATAYGLIGRLFPSVHAVGGIADTGRLAEPVGYWNGLGILAAMGAIIALGLAAHARTVPGRILAAGTLPIVITALYFTFSRGAWIAFAVGLVAAVAVDRKRWFLLATLIGAAPWLVLDVALAATSSALTHAASKVGPTATEGHRLTAVLVLSGIGLAATVWALHVLERRFQPSAALTRTGHLATGAAVVLLILVALVRFGSPITIAGDMYDRFNAPPPGGFKGTAAHAGRDLNMRLFSLSGNARADLWRIAWHDYQRHEVLGAGAGTYESYYLQHRTTGLKVKNAHNLYLETLADLGPIGLLLLVAGLAAPLVAGVRAREEALRPDRVRRLRGLSPARRRRLGLADDGRHPDRPHVRRRHAHEHAVAAVVDIALEPRRARRPPGRDRAHGRARPRRAAGQRRGGRQPARGLDPSLGHGRERGPHRRELGAVVGRRARRARPRTAGRGPQRPRPGRRSRPRSHVTRAAGRHGSTSAGRAAAGRAGALLPTRSNSTRASPRCSRCTDLHGFSRRL